MEYNEWHDEEGVEFHSQGRVRFSCADINKRMSLHELCRVTADVAVEDYRLRGFSREFLVENGIAILVSRNSFRIHGMPKENERYELVTWEEKPQALQLVRCYKIVGENSVSLVSAKSTWLIMDLKNRRIMPTKKFTLRPEPLVQRAMDCFEPSKISYDDGRLALWDRHLVKFSDLDSNGHTTNSRYAAFADDALPSEFHEKRLTDFRVNYSKEAMLGDEILIYGCVDSVGASVGSVLKTEGVHGEEGASSKGGSQVGATKVTIVGKTKDFVSFEAELFFAEE